MIVDEAHKFRNDTAEAFDELQRIPPSNFSRLGNMSLDCAERPWLVVTRGRAHCPADQSYAAAAFGSAMILLCFSRSAFAAATDAGVIANHFLASAGRTSSR